MPSVARSSSAVRPRSAAPRSSTPPIRPAQRANATGQYLEARPTIPTRIVSPVSPVSLDSPSAPVLPAAPAGHGPQGHRQRAHREEVGGDGLEAPEPSPVGHAGEQIARDPPLGELATPAAVVDADVEDPRPVP